MSFCGVFCSTCFPRVSSASATSASSPTEGGPRCCHYASPLSTPLYRKTKRKRRLLLHAPTVALSQVRRTDGRRRTIYSRTTPTPFSTAPGHGRMKSLAHIPHGRRAAERLAEVCSVTPRHRLPLPALAHFGHRLVLAQVCRLLPHQPRRLSPTSTPPAPSIQFA